ncbi:hypothetical protein [Hyphomicrobium sp. CS1BSMeth3]|uniref:hypothetical protein n=1 Tax=Hyphomicrobium sp. CS1BSMeth3 TaxID=1892844 RepID=UPI0011603998|nr:hypothetical protein [Hyphomicrobium sp. CS1BSMeth3]
MLRRMMTSEKRLAELTAFENVLDTFGGNSARWPAEKRERLMSLAASDAEAGRLLREAKALDTVLAHAAGPPVGETKALADRIAAAVANTAPGQSPGKTAHAERQTGGSTPSSENTSGVVIAWPRGAGENPRVAAQAGALTGSVPQRERFSSGWRTAALLAASLVAGIFVGVADLVPSEVTQIVASATTGTETPQALAFLSGEGLLEIIEEEFL